MPRRKTVLKSREENDLPSLGELNAQTGEKYPKHWHIQALKALEAAKDLEKQFIHVVEPIDSKTYKLKRVKRRKIN